MSDIVEEIWFNTILMDGWQEDMQIYFHNHELIAASWAVMFTFLRNHDYGSFWDSRGMMPVKSTKYFHMIDATVS